jgi:uncharacterized membrane protein
MLNEIQSNNKYLFALVSILAIFNIVFLPPLYLYIPLLNFLAAASLFLLIIFSYFFFKGKSKQSKIIALFIFISFVVQFFLLPHNIGIVKIVLSLNTLLFWFFLYLPISFLIFFGFYLYKSKAFRHSKAIALILFIPAFVLLAYYNFGIIISWYPDDEMFLQMLSANSIINLHNPYQQNYTNLLFYNLSRYGATLTTKNSIIGVLDYPALFALVEVPFSILNLGVQQTTKLQVLISTIILFMSIGYLAKKEEIEKPSYIIIIGILVALLVISSTIEALMLSIMLFAFSKSGSKYGWLFMGLAASIQEMLWVPVLFLILYTFEKFGYKQGIKELSLTILVFLIINAPFIIGSPYQFFSKVLAPATYYIVPDSYGLAGYLISAFYPIPLGAYGVLSLIFIIVGAAFFLYSGEKRLVFLSSLIPLAFLSHGIVTYYSFFIGSSILSISLEYAKGKVLFNKNKTWLLYIIAILLLVAIVFVSLEHIKYEHIFYVKSIAENYSIANNTFYYNITIAYKTNVSRFITLIAIYNGSTFLYGMKDNILLGSNENATPNMVDPNIIYLNSSGIKRISYVVNLPKNIGLFYADTVIFNGSYVYYMPPIKISTS